MRGKDGAFEAHEQAEGTVVAGPRPVLVVGCRSHQLPIVRLGGRVCSGDHA
jgi:hypothetical protein